VLDFINKAGLMRGKPLRVEDIDAILQSLVYDARLEITRGVQCGPGEARAYKLLETCHEFAPHHVQVPCSVCPMFADCAPDAEINPQSCEYLDRWLRHPGAPAGSNEELSW
jgi:DNA-directed RNA polymerase III subunit RPC6